VGLLFIFNCMNNVHAMQAELDEYKVERNFLKGIISPNQYLSYLASLSGDYSYKIRALRNVKDFTYYEQLLNDMAIYCMRHQSLVNSLNISEIRIFILDMINMFYDNLEKGNIQYGREL